MQIKANDKGEVMFRHPVALNKDGYGRPVCRGIGKHPKGVQGKIEEHLEKLFDLKPRLRSDVKEELHEIALDIWFRPLEPKKKPTTFAFSNVATTPLVNESKKIIAAELERAKVEVNPRKWDENTKWFIEHLCTVRIIDLEQSLNAALKKISELEAQKEGLIKATGAETEETQGITLEACLVHFKKHVSCKSEDAKENLLRRVEVVIEKLGFSTKHSAVTKKMIVDKVKEIDPDVDGKRSTEATYKLRDIKRFFTLLSFDRSSDGLGLANPAAAIKPGMAKPSGNVDVLDPLEIGKLKDLSQYWKAFAACCGLAGMRLAEAASLEWSMLDEKKKIIRLRKTKHYPDLKNEVSERDIKPFPNFWKIVEAHQKSATHKDLVFPRLWNSDEPATNRRFKNKDNETWFEQRADKARAINLPGALADALKAAGFEREKPALSLRHFWVTTMESKGLGDLLDSMAGNSARVRQKHYMNHKLIVENAEIPKL